MKQRRLHLHEVKLIEEVNRHFGLSLTTPSAVFYFDSWLTDHLNRGMNSDFADFRLGTPKNQLCKLIDVHPINLSTSWCLSYSQDGIPLRLEQDFGDLVKKDDFIESIEAIRHSLGHLGCDSIVKYENASRLATNLDHIFFLFNEKKLLEHLDSCEVVTSDNFSVAYAMQEDKIVAIEGWINYPTPNPSERVNRIT